MHKKPNIQDEKIIAGLHAEFGLRVRDIAFLPLGGDLSTAVYRARAENGTMYFCKLKFDSFDEISVQLPKYLNEQGIDQIISPLVSKSGRLWAVFDEFRVILYPFVEGKSGFDMELTEPQWAEFGEALKRIHTMHLPAVLAHKLRQEDFSAKWRTICQDVIRRIDQEEFTDPITRDFASYLGLRRDPILDQLAHAERLASMMISRPIERVLCHTDIHPGNLFINKAGRLFIIDWDYPMLAPKERDLMFVGGGQGYMGLTAEEEERFFYSYYVPAYLDPEALAYYRCERNIIDICVESTRILSSAVNDTERAQSLQIITWLFLPEGSIEMAYKALRNM